MNAVDASEHYDSSASELAPSLLTVILDTNPRAWAVLEDKLPFSKALANILVFINAHLACNYTNEIAVIASHTQRAAWLYPSFNQYKPSHRRDADGDVQMNGQATTQLDSNQANMYRPFRVIEEQVTENVKELLASTNASDIQSTTSTMMAGALTLALSHINRRSMTWAETHGAVNLDAPHAPTGPSAAAVSTSGNANVGLQSRILIVSVSSSTDSAHQYIPIMNGIFACQRLHVPVDVCKLSGDAVFLQQAADATRGVYMSPTEPRGLLQYLMMAFLPDQRSRKHLILPSRVDVDFRAACFCHRRVVNIGFVCSICLSIFCEPPENGDCLTCGTHLEIGDYGSKPAVIARKKKKKKARLNGSSATGTPTPGATPGL
ncbi:putative transcription factor TFIIH subunit Tfb4 [Talaromyces proteolyticus]|uniref:General transcription and DNA repair factor IIH subunit TFB4 n=1 Tax=Talaromyces proteolyticus TaxID=1131652 RepID=A0AAD4L1Z0_9EURO|nr:putative transcription factor TFIIH subunit Tfb4 [Talaromyces proteolyticus]KAH8705141.1 putative transcription factor TFIIH subunit Tfb4 [Talaromyces proteolyticus]